MAKKLKKGVLEFKEIKSNYKKIVEALAKYGNGETEASSEILATLEEELSVKSGFSTDKLNKYLYKVLLYNGDLNVEPELQAKYKPILDLFGLGDMYGKENNVFQSQVKGEAPSEDIFAGDAAKYQLANVLLAYLKADEAKKTYEIVHKLPYDQDTIIKDLLARGVIEVDETDASKYNWLLQVYDTDGVTPITNPAILDALVYLAKETMEVSEEAEDIGKGFVKKCETLTSRMDWLKNQAENVLGNPALYSNLNHNELLGLSIDLTKIKAVDPADATKKVALYSTWNGIVTPTPNSLAYNDLIDQIQDTRQLLNGEGTEVTSKDLDIILGHLDHFINNDLVIENSDLTLINKWLDSGSTELTPSVLAFLKAKNAYEIGKSRFVYDNTGFDSTQAAQKKAQLQEYKKIIVSAENFIASLNGLVNKGTASDSIIECLHRGDAARAIREASYTFIDISTLGGLDASHPKLQEGNRLLNLLATLRNNKISEVQAIDGGADPNKAALISTALGKSYGTEHGVGIDELEGLITAGNIGIDEGTQIIREKLDAINKELLKNAELSQSGIAPYLDDLKDSTNKRIRPGFWHRFGRSLRVHSKAFSFAFFGGVVLAKFATHLIAGGGANWVEALKEIVTNWTPESGALTFGIAGAVGLVGVIGTIVDTFMPGHKIDKQEMLIELNSKLQYKSAASIIELQQKNVELLKILEDDTKTPNERAKAQKKLDKNNKTIEKYLKQAGIDTQDAEDANKRLEEITKRGKSGDEIVERQGIYHVHDVNTEAQAGDHGERTEAGKLTHVGDVDRAKQVNEMIAEIQKLTKARERYTFINYKGKTYRISSSGILKDGVHIVNPYGITRNHASNSDVIGTPTEARVSDVIGEMVQDVYDINERNSGR